MLRSVTTPVARTPAPASPPTGPGEKAPIAPAGRGNLAPWDRITRLVLGTALLYMGWALLTGVPAAVVGAAGVVFLATGTAGACPLYAVTGIGTRAAGARHP